jgi:hypothetical protein
MQNNIPMQRPEEEEISPLMTTMPEEMATESAQEPKPKFVNFANPEVQQTPQPQNLLMSGIDQQKQSAIQQAVIEGETAQAMQNVYAQGEKQLMSKEAQFQEKAQERQQKLDDLAKKFEAQQAAVKDMSLKGVDWWGSKTSGEKVMAGIGLFLSALSPQSMNNTLNLIDKEVERDLNIQKANLDKAKGELGDTQNLIGLYRDSLKDDRLAFDAARINQYELIKMKLERQAMAAKSPMAKAKIGELMGKLDEKVGLLQAKALQEAAKTGGGQIQTPKFQGTIKDKTMAKDFIEEATDVQAISEGLDRLSKFANSSMSKLSTEDRAKIETDINLLVGALNRPLTGGGPMAEAEAERIRNTIGDPSKFLSLPSSTKAKLSSLKDFINRKHEIKAANLGLKPIQANFATFKPENK